MAIAEPRGKILLTPAPVFFHRVEGPIGRVVQYRLVGTDKGVAKPLSERPARGCLEFSLPLTQIFRAHGVRVCRGQRLVQSHEGFEVSPARRTGSRSSSSILRSL